MEQQYKHDYEEVQCIGRGAYGKFLSHFTFSRCGISGHSQNRKEKVHCKVNHALRFKIKREGERNA